MTNFDIDAAPHPDYPFCETTEEYVAWEAGWSAAVAAVEPLIAERTLRDIELRLQSASAAAFLDGDTGSAATWAWGKSLEIVRREIARADALTQGDDE